MANPWICTYLLYTHYPNTQMRTYTNAPALCFDYTRRKDKIEDVRTFIRHTIQSVNTCCTNTTQTRKCALTQTHPRIAWLLAQKKITFRSTDNPPYNRPRRRVIIEKNVLPRLRKLFQQKKKTFDLFVFRKQQSPAYPQRIDSQEALSSFISRRNLSIRLC